MLKIFCRAALKWKKIDAFRDQVGAISGPAHNLILITREKDLLQLRNLGMRRNTEIDNLWNGIISSNMNHPCA